MDVTIRNTEDGKGVHVTDQYQLSTQAESIPQQHYISKRFGRTFQAYGTSGTLSAGTITVLHIRNDDPARYVVVTYMRAQIVDAAGGAFDALTDYLEMGFDRTVATGGTAMIPTNMNRASGVAPTVTVTHSAPTMAGTFAGTGDEWHPTVSGDSAAYNKEGSLILGLGETMEIRYVGTHTSGEINARVTFMLVDKNGD